MNTLRVVIWNIEWRLRDTKAGRILRERIDEHSPDIICITEGHESFLQGHGHLISAGPNFGYRAPVGRRKVLLWSRAPWTEEDQIGDPTLPEGRFVAATTVTPVGSIRFIGVCIPWAHAHVNMGRRDRKPWDEHCAFLRGLSVTLASPACSNSTILLGDFNQTVPRRRAPKRVHEALLDTLSDQMVLATSGPIPGVDLLSIDHLASTSDLEAVRVQALPNRAEDGSRLSDHFGLVVELRKAAPSPDI